MVTALLFTKVNVSAAYDQTINNSELINTLSGNKAVEKYLKFTNMNGNFRLSTCTVSINQSFANGTSFSGTLTFHELGFFQCVKLKILSLFI